MYCFYTDNVSFEPGKTVRIYKYEYVPAYEGVKEVRLALYSYTTSDGVTHHIPESQQVWYSSKSGWLEKPDTFTRYTEPTEEESRLAGTIDFGIDMAASAINTSGYYQTARHGLLVDYVREDSIASEAGIHLRDLIYGIDGVLWTDDPRILTKAEARYMQGETVTLMIERNGETIEIQLSRPQAAQ